MCRFLTSIFDQNMCQKPGCAFFTPIFFTPFFFQKIFFEISKFGVKKIGVKKYPPKTAHPKKRATIACGSDLGCVRDTIVAKHVNGQYKFCRDRFNLLINPNPGDAGWSGYGI